MRWSQCLALIGFAGVVAFQAYPKKAMAADLPAVVDHLHVSPAERAAETNRLAKFGWQGDPLREWPYAPPIGTRSYVVPQAWIVSALKADHSKISAHALRTDLPLLRTALEEAYVGWKPAEVAGWNWDKWFKDWDKMLQKAGDKQLPFEEAFAPYKKLTQLRIDNHSGFQGKGTAQYGCFSRTSVLAETPTRPCTKIRNLQGTVSPIDPHDPGQQPKPALASDGHSRIWYIAYPDSCGNITAVRCGSKWIKSQPSIDLPDEERLAAIEALAGTTNDVPVRRKIAADITYYRLPSFSLENNTLLDDLLSKEGPSLDQDKLTIVDLRANDGGYAPLRWLGHWTKSRVLKSAGIPSKLRSSKLYAALRWNLKTVMEIGAKPRTYNSMLNVADVLDDPNAAAKAEAETPPSDWNYAKHRFPEKPKLLILTDNTCGSDGELMVYFLAAAEGSVIAGVNTAGICQHIQPGYLVLPHTNLVFRMALGLSQEFADNRSVDGYGLDVDILLPTPESNSPESILRLANTLMNFTGAASSRVDNLSPSSSLVER
jgi:hypothetical protein